MNCINMGEIMPSNVTQLSPQSRALSPSQINSLACPYLYHLILSSPHQLMVISNHANLQYYREVYKIT
jgi:hypothetical protein